MASVEVRLSTSKDFENRQKIAGYFFLILLIIAFIAFVYLVSTGKILSKTTGIKS